MHRARDMPDLESFRRAPEILVCLLIHSPCIRGIGSKCVRPWLLTVQTGIERCACTALHRARGYVVGTHAYDMQKGRDVKDHIGYCEPSQH